MSRFVSLTLSRVLHSETINMRQPFFSAAKDCRDESVKLPFHSHGVLVDVSQVIGVFAATVFVQHAVTKLVPEKEINQSPTLPL